jgi:proteasome assembly chaperone (PAC2) family protein
MSELDDALQAQRALLATARAELDALRGQARLDQLAQQARDLEAEAVALERRADELEAQVEALQEREEAALRALKA